LLAPGGVCEDLDRFIRDTLEDSIFDAEDSTLVSLGDSIVEATAFGGNIELMEFIVSVGFDVCMSSKALSCAAQSGNVKMVKYFYKNNHNIDSDALNNAFIQSVNFNHHDTMLYLAKKGANLNQQHSLALRRAAKHGYFGMVKYLVENGSVISSVNNEALRNAARQGWTDIVKYLVSRGADPSTESYRALFSAINNRNVHMFIYLDEHTPDISDETYEILMQSANIMNCIGVVIYLAEKKNVPLYYLGFTLACWRGDKSMVKNMI
jgi:hypothetical protein